MSRVIIFISVVLTSLTLIKCKQVKSDNVKTTLPTATTTTPATKHQEIRNNIDVTTAMKDCNETFRIEMVFLEQLNSSGSFPDETDRTPKCYTRCVLETTGVIAEDGQLDSVLAAIVLAGLRGNMDTNVLEEIATGCTDRNETCKCERSYQFIKCIMEKEIEKM